MKNRNSFQTRYPMIIDQLILKYPFPKMRKFAMCIFQIDPSLFSTVDRRSYAHDKDLCRLKLHSRDSISSSYGENSEIKNYSERVFHPFNGRFKLLYCKSRSGLTDFFVENQRLLYPICEHNV